MTVIVKAEAKKMLALRMIEFLSTDSLPLAAIEKMCAKAAIVPPRAYKKEKKKESSLTILWHINIRGLI